MDEVEKFLFIIGLMLCFYPFADSFTMFVYRVKYGDEATQLDKKSLEQRKGVDRWVFQGLMNLKNNKWRVSACGAGLLFFDLLLKVFF